MTTPNPALTVWHTEDSTSDLDLLPKVNQGQPEDLDRSLESAVSADDKGKPFDYYFIVLCRLVIWC